MSKNEYRRTLIMLRPRARDCAGHARLERRVMMGSLYFLATAPEGGELRAALAGQRGGTYFAADCGALRRDGRGQASLAWNFDPRNIDGRPLDAYALAVVVRVSRDGCALLLSGNLDGARPMDMAQVQAAVCALYAGGGEPAADLPEPGAEEGAAQEGNQNEAPDEPPAPEELPLEGGSDGAIPEDAEAVQESVETAPESAEAAPEPVEPADPPMETAGPAAIPEPMADPDGPTRIYTMVRPRSAAAGGETALQRLGLRGDEAWTGALEPLRERFERQHPVETLEDDFIYIAAPLPGWEAGGPLQEECRIGLRASDGVVEAIRYALPAVATQEPPEGLEGWTWVGNDTHGYWVRTVDAQSGAEA